MAKRAQYRLQFTLDFEKPLTLPEVSKLESYLQEGLGVWGPVRVVATAAQIIGEVEETKETVTKEQLLEMEGKVRAGKQ